MPYYENLPPQLLIESEGPASEKHDSVNLPEELTFSAKKAMKTQKRPSNFKMELNLFDLKP